MEKIDTSRRGKIEINNPKISPASLHKAFGYLEFIPVFCEQRDFGRDIIMVGISPRFEQVPEYSRTPCYDILFKNGQIEVVKKSNF